MPGVARKDDTTSHGGVIISGCDSVLVNGLPVARIGDLHNCPEHGLGTITTGSGSVTAGGAGVARIGDMTSCGAVIISGSQNVEID